MRKSSSLSSSPNSIYRVTRERRTLSENVLLTEKIYHNNIRLHIREKISSSKYSIILKVQNDLTNQLFALKILNTPINDCQKADDFKKEIQLLSMFHSKNIVKFFSEINLAISKGILLEYCSYGNLYDFLKNPNNIDVINILYNYMCKDVMNAIFYLHSLHILHRDIKSPNYLIGDKFILKLCDFNLSREFDSGDTLKNWRTTPLWSAPELYDHQYSEKSDIYSSGIVLWEVLFTKYNGRYKSLEIKDNPLDYLIYPLNLSMDNIPKYWIEILNCMCNKDPKLRSGSEDILIAIDKLI